jgi:ABC-type multidrug transport system fused ATPase/permease subunit
MSDLFTRIYAILLPEERKKGWSIAGSVFLTALLDFVGLAVLLPVLYYLIDGQDNGEAAMQFCILALIVITIKCILSTFFIRYQNKTLLSFYKRLSFSLFSSYYQRGLLFIREQGSSKLSFEINSMCYSFSHSLLSPIFRMMGDILLIMLVTIALIIWKGKLVMLLFVAFLPFMCVYFLVVKNKVRQYGAEDMNAKREQSRVVMDTFRGYVELEVNGAFPALQSSFLDGIDKISSNRLKLDAIQRLPLFFSELSVVIALVLLVAFAKGDVKLMVSIFAIAAFRLLPALRNILSCWTQIQNSKCCLDAIEDGLKDDKIIENPEQKGISFCRNIIIENLTYSYPGGEMVLDNFNCIINKGEYVGIKGTSGAGKSTFFNLLIGLLEPVSGTIKIDGNLLSRQTYGSWIQQFGYVPQDVFIFNGTIAENIALGCNRIDYDKVNQILKSVNLDKWVEAQQDGVNTALSEAGSKLSGGQKQRIGIARALYKEAAVLMLDESTSALDNETERDINDTLKTLKDSYKGLTILSIAHRESSLSYCDRIITIGEQV